MSDEVDALLGTLIHGRDGAVDATWGRAVDVPTLVSQSRSGGSPSAPVTLPQLEFATPRSAQAEGTLSELVPLQLLGAGGMGQVLTARQASLAREVAVKVLKTDATEPEVQALIDEARIAGSLEHPGVVPIYALARDGRGFPAVVMKRVEGTSWAELLRAPDHPAWAKVAPVGKDQLETHVGILIQVCNALAFAHRRGVIHRDVKPDNVLVGELGEVFLADWGVAMKKATGGPPQLVGTPAYMAPEMVLGDPQGIDERSDVYLAGATLHEVLTGKHLHEGDELAAVLRKAIEARPPVFGPEVPRELAALCTRAVAAKKGDRPADALAFRDGLLAFLQHRGAAKLTDSAIAKLEALERAFAAREAEATQKAYALFSECRFAFTQALADWPENDAAKAGLQRAITAAVRFELERGSVDAARALLAELGAPPQELKRALDEALALRAARLRETERFHREARENNPEISARERNAFLVTLSMTSGLAYGVFKASEGTEWGAAMGEWLRVVPMFFFLFVLGLGSFLGRRTLLATRVNRQLMAVIGLGALGVLAVDSLFIALRLPQFAASAVNGVLAAYGLASISIFTHRSFLFPASIWLVAAALALVLRDRPGLVFMVAGTIAFLVAVIAWRSWRDAVAKGTDET